MIVKVRYYSYLEELLGKIKQETYEFEEGDTLKELLFKKIPQRHRNIAEKWNELIFEKKYKINFSVLINGKYCSLSENTINYLI